LAFGFQIFRYVSQVAEINIRGAPELPSAHPIFPHHQIRQQKDIEDYIQSVDYADSDRPPTVMRRCVNKDKELVVEMLTESADGM
jgi:hypothetical protein